MTETTPAKAPQLDPELQKRKDEAEVRSAEEKARADRAAADKAEREARKAELDNQKAEREAEEHASADAAAGRRAELAQKTAEADRDAASARTAALTALVPDLGQVQGGTVTVAADARLGDALAYHALAHVATAIATGLPASAKPFLVTTEADLATADAVHADVTTGLEQLVAAADRVLDPEDQVQTQGVTTLIAALASAVPSLISLLRTDRSLSTAATTVSDTAAVAAVVDALLRREPPARVVHDTLRLLDTRSSVVHAQLGTVEQRKSQLRARKIELAQEIADADARAAEHRATLKAVRQKILEAAGTPDGDPELAKLRSDAASAQRAIELETTTASKLQLRTELGDSVVQSIETYVAALRTVPQGAQRSPLATAALQEQLHPPESARIGHVLLVRAEAGSTRQIVSDRRVRKDLVSVEATMSIAHLCLSTADGTIVAAGTVTRSVVAKGAVGDVLRLEVVAAT